MAHVQREVLPVRADSLVEFFEWLRLVGHGDKVSVIVLKSSQTRPEGSADA